MSDLPKDIEELLAHLKKLRTEDVNVFLAAARSCGYMLSNNDFLLRVLYVLYPKGVSHPNQAEPDALINEIRRLMRDHDTWKNKYLMKISEPVKHD